MPAAAPSAELVDWLCVLVRRGVRVGSGKGKSLAAFFGFKPVIPPRKASGLLTLELVSEKLYIGISMIFLVGDGCLVPAPKKQRVKDEKRLCCPRNFVFGPPCAGGGENRNPNTEANSYTKGLRQSKTALFDRTLFRLDYSRPPS